MYAEIATEFLRWCLKIVFKDDQVHEITDKPKTQILFYESGMYIIWDEELLPVYIGITGRTFADRFQEHINSGKITTKMFASMIQMKLPVAKFLESTFLTAFNFARNEQENDKVRELELEQNKISVQDGKKKFAKILSEYVQFLQNINNNMGNVV